MKIVERIDLVLLVPRLDLRTLRQGAGESESIASTRRKRSRNGARSTFRGVSVTRAAVVWSGEEFRRDAIGGGAAHSVRGWKGG